MKTLKLLAILAIMVPFSSCTTENVEADNTYNSVSIKPNQCDEPWDDAAYTTQTKLIKREDRFKAYLSDKGIKDLKNFKNTTDDKIYCQACTCPSNDNYSFELNKTEFEKLKTIERFKPKS